MNSQGAVRRPSARWPSCRRKPSGWCSRTSLPIIVIPSRFAVLRFTTTSNLFGSCKEIGGLFTLKAARPVAVDDYHVGPSAYQLRSVRLHARHVARQIDSKNSYELPSPHSISSSASVSSEGGTVAPSALANLTLMTSSNFVGCSMSEGSANWRYWPRVALTPIAQGEPGHCLNRRAGREELSNAPRFMAYLLWESRGLSPRARVMSPSPCSARHGGGDKHSLMATSNARLTLDPVQKLRS